jgi:hypothetical protein
MTWLFGKKKAKAAAAIAGSVVAASAPAAQQVDPPRAAPASVKAQAGATLARQPNESVRNVFDDMARQQRMAASLMVLHRRLPELMLTTAGDRPHDISQKDVRRVRRVISILIEAGRRAA